MKTRRSRVKEETQSDEGDAELVARGRQPQTRKSTRNIKSGNAAAASLKPKKAETPPRRSSRLNTQASSPGPITRRSTRNSKVEIKHESEEHESEIEEGHNETADFISSGKTQKDKEDEQESEKEESDAEEKPASREDSDDENDDKDEIKASHVDNLTEEKSNDESKADEEMSEHDGEKEIHEHESENHEQDHEDDNTSSPPVKEISTTPSKRKSSRNASKTRERRDRDSEEIVKNHGEGPKYLDENSLSILDSFLKEYNGEKLDEDDVMGFSVRMHRIADQQANYQKSLIVGKNSRHRADEYDDNDKDFSEDDTSIFEECLAEEEDHAVRHDLYRKVVTSIQGDEETKNPSRIKNGGSKCSRTTGLLLDKKTLLWLKRAAGIHRPSGGIALQKEGKGGRMSTRRFTRKQAQDNRQKKKERGLDILGEAANGLEEEYGPFPKRTVKKRSGKKNRRPKDSLEQQKSAQELEADHKRKNEGDKENIEIIDDSQRKKKKAKLTNDIDVELRKQKKNTFDLGKKLINAHDRKRKIVSGDPGRIPKKKKKICTSLRTLDWLWRKNTQKYDISKLTVETDAEYRKRKNIILHPRFRSAGIVHCLPRLSHFSREQYRPNELPGRVFDPPRLRHSDKKYAELCHRLMSCLQGQARLFAMCEFFYSDIDRQWYNRNTFAEDVAALGIPRDTELSRTEWKTIRRSLRKRPRRFSRAFIVSQLGERNEFRATFRLLQNNPHLSETIKFPYDVYAPISVGTTVAAYSKRFRLAQRGRILAYDRVKAIYLVEFENKQFGFELCPDSEIATCGNPEILFAGSKNQFLRGRAQDDLSCLNGTRTGPLFAGASIPDTFDFSSVQDAFSFAPTVINGSKNYETKASKSVGSILETRQKRKSLYDRIANHEAFLTLIEVIDVARNRKNVILRLLDDANALMAENLPFGGKFGQNNTLTNVTREHLRWLLSNLERTNRVLNTAISYLQLLYGESSTTNGRNSSQDTRHILGKLCQEAREQDCEQLDFALNNAAHLAANADDVGSVVASNMSKNIDFTDFHIHKKSTNLEQRLKTASQLLCISKFIVQSADSDQGVKVLPALFSAATKLLKNHFPIASRTSEEIYDKVLDARANAVSDLNEAIDLFRAEIEVAYCKKSLAVGTE